MKTETRNTLY